MVDVPGDGVKTISRAFRLLELLADAEGPLTVSELTALADEPLPTVHRMLRTLVAHGYVRQEPNRRYALGVRLIRIGSVATLQFGQLASPQLKDLVARLGETANLATLDGDQALYVSQAPSPHAMRMFTEVGHRAPLHASGVGKAILAQLPDATVLDILERTGLPAATEKSITSPTALLLDLREVRERGFAVDDGEQELGVRCFAVPIPGAPTPTAVSVSGPATRLDAAAARRAVVALKRVATEISKIARLTSTRAR